MATDSRPFFSARCLRLALLAPLLGLLSCAPSVTQESVDTTPTRGEKSDETLIDIGRLDSTLQRELTRRQLSLERHAAWQIMHGFLPYGSKLTVNQQGTTVNLLDHLLAGGAMQGWELYPGDVIPSTKRKGVITRLSEADYFGQGHVDQWLAIFAQAGVPKETQIRVGDATFTVEDWLRQSQYDVSRNLTAEYAWTLIALSHYFPEERSWVARDGNRWDWETMVEFELNEDLVTAACGGTHRLEALALTLQTHLNQGGKLDGIWLATRQRLDSEIEKVRRWQNRDGSLSSHFFERPGATADLVQRLSSSGHLFEFVVIAAPEEMLQARWLQRAAQRICELLDLTADQELECGSLYHALNGLRVYRDRLAAQRPNNDPA